MNFISSIVRPTFPSSSEWHGKENKWQVRKTGGDKNPERNPRQYKDWLKKQGNVYNIYCKWEPFRAQILAQWSRLTPAEVDKVGPNRSMLAQLIQNRYGVDAYLVENYLRNFERTLPLI